MTAAAATVAPTGRLNASSFRSVPDMWHHRCRSTPDATAMIYRDGAEWSSLSWRAAEEKSREVANGLLAFGLGAEDRCCLLSKTCVDWVIVDMAILAAGGATTTIYPSNTAEECRYIIDDCDAVLVFCDTDHQAKKLQQIRDQIPKVKAVVVFDGTPSADGWVRTLAQLRKEGRDFAEKNPNAYQTASEGVSPDRMATLIYTSGTTGNPKGVILTHDAWVYEAEAIDAMGLISPADKQFLFLPLSHVFAKVMEVIFIRLGVPTVVDGDIDTLVANLGETSPSWMAGVPRIFEKAYTRIVTGAREAGGIKASLFEWSLDVGKQVSALRQRGKDPTGLLRLKYALADKLVFAKVKATFGGKLRFFISGGAPLSKDIAEFFHACDILILEGYGLTESGAASTVNPIDDFVFGTVGKPVPGCDVKIADDGEILISSRGVMKGYYNRPEDTAEALFVDETGKTWLRTGDIGVLLERGHVKITDRKKELIITAGGKNIAPAHFQGLLKARCTFVSQVLMHGDRRPYCVALLSINADVVGPWAAKNQIPFASYAELAARPEVHAAIWREVELINKDLPSYETVKRIAILPEDLTQENGALTPSLKIKRKVVEERYRDVLAGLYAGHE
jgi:long-chain acyl-CoA synthetase